MKKLFVLIAIALFIAGCIRTIPPPDMSATGTTESGYSYQGPIDPAEFETWTEIYTEPVMTPFGVIFDTYLTNPDPKAQIQLSNIVVTSSGIDRYFLFYDGQFYFYSFNPDTACYERQEIDAELSDILKRDFQNAFGLRFIDGG